MGKISLRRKRVGGVRPNLSSAQHIQGVSVEAGIGSCGINGPFDFTLLRQSSIPVSCPPDHEKLLYRAGGKDCRVRCCRYFGHRALRPVVFVQPRQRFGDLYARGVCDPGIVWKFRGLFTPPQRLPEIAELAGEVPFVGGKRYSLCPRGHVDVPVLFEQANSFARADERTLVMAKRGFVFVDIGPGQREIRNDCDGAALIGDSGVEVASDGIAGAKAKKGPGAHAWCRTFDCQVLHDASRHHPIVQHVRGIDRIAVGLCARIDGFRHPLEKPVEIRVIPGHRSDAVSTR
jgi:hypothetical protein